MNTTKKVILSATFALATLTTHWSSAAEVRKISPEMRHESATETRWSVNVVCADVERMRVIERIGNSGQWCSIDLPNTCSNRKVKAAKKVCGTHFERRVAERQQQNQETTEKQTTSLAVNQPDSGIVEKTSQAIKKSAPTPDSTESIVTDGADEYIDTLLTNSSQDSITLTKEMIEIEEEKIALAEKELKLKLKELELRKNQVTQ